MLFIENNYTLFYAAIALLLSRSQLLKGVHLGIESKIGVFQVRISPAACHPINRIRNRKKKP